MLLYGLEKDQDFQYLNTRLLVSCPANGPDEGGLFSLDFKHNSLKKLYTASCIGITWVNDRLIVTTDDNQIIGCYEVDTFMRIGEIRFNPADKNIHHINDIWLEGNTLYVSMFSPYDKWYLDPVKKTAGLSLST